MLHKPFISRSRLVTLLILYLLFNSMTANAATITQTAVNEVALSSTIQIDSAATDFYIFGENVQKSGEPSVFSDVSGPFSPQTDSEVRIAWTGGDPTVSATGSTKYDVCLSGKGFKSPTPVSCQFTVKMPSTAATLEFWLIPNGNTKSISYDVTVGGVKNSYSNQPSKRHYRRFAYTITDAQVDESITVAVNNITGINDWHSLGFQAAQLKVIKAIQTLEFKPVTKGTVGQSATLSATASSGLTDIKFASTTESICTVNGTQVSFKDAGTCAVTAKQAGNSNYLPVTASGEILVADKPTETALLGKTVGDAEFSLPATSDQDLTVEWTLMADSQGCTLNGNKITPVSAGTCIIHGFQAGNATTNPTQTVVRIEIKDAQPIEPQEQNLSISLVADHNLVGEVATVKVSLGESGNTVDLQVSTPEICNLQGTGVTLLKEGTCTVTGTQAGNTQYLEASASSSVTVKTDKATFGLKVLSNKDNSGQLTQVSQADTVNIELQVTAAVKDVGKTAELFLTVKLGNDLYILTHEGWQPWDGVTWTPVTQQTLTDEAITIPAFSGQFPASGTFEFTAAYGLTGSSAISQGPQAVGNLTVTAFNPVEQAKTDCLGKSGIYYAQQCFTDVKDLGNGFAGGIYVEGQASLQTNANLACRLGKKVAVLGRFNVSDDDVGQPAEVVFAFQDNLDNATGKTIGALPKIYSAALFEGELPTTGTLPVSFGYRLLNSEGSKGVLKSATGLTFVVPVDSCDNPDLQLVTSPLGTGTGEVLTKTAEDGSVRLVAIPATDGSAFAGWTGDAEGCKGTETTLIIKPSADKFTCQPTFSKQVLGTLKCENGFDTEQNIACCGLNDPKCPAIPEPCNPPKDPNTQWLLNIPPSTALDVVNIRVTNLSQENREVKATLYDIDGKLIFENKTLVEAKDLPQFAAVPIQMADLTSNGENWNGRGKLKIPNPEGLLIQAFLRAREATGFPETPLMNMTFASAKHRVTAIPPPKKGVIGADQITIRITNIGDTEMKVKMRLFSQEGGDPIWVGDLMTEALPPIATSRFTSDDLATITGTTWEGRAFAEIFPEDVKQRCNGKMLMQNLVRQNGIRMAPLSNITPQD